jgi:hypothetical protein
VTLCKACRAQQRRALADDQVALDLGPPDDCTCAEPSAREIPNAAEEAAKIIAALSAPYPDAPAYELRDRVASCGHRVQAYDHETHAMCSVCLLRRELAPVAPAEVIAKRAEERAVQAEQLAEAAPQSRALLEGVARRARREASAARGEADEVGEAAE